MKDYDAFMELVKAGLWENDAQLSPFGTVNYSDVMRLAEEQSVVGLVASGLEHVTDVKAPKPDVLQFVGQALQLEQRNTAMNYFIGVIVDKLKEAGIKTLLVKGQGVAQCYERPLWRYSGDVDFMLDDQNYQSAREFLLPLSSDSKQDEMYSKHLGMTIDPWYVEIHGTLRTGLSARVDREVDAVYEDTMKNNHVRIWKNGETDVILPSADNDVFLVFTHFIKHFYKEGMGLRQVCDWIRMLWTYRDEIDDSLLENRLQQSGLMDEWHAFAVLAVEHLGMPVESMPFYSVDVKWREKAEKIVYYILRGFTGKKYKDTYQLYKIFPWNTICFLPGIFMNVNWLKIKERFFKN